MGTQPNIIFILSDQHNPGVIGRGGDAWIRTPNLDRLMDNGTALTNCYSASPLCVPSRASLLSGLLPCHSGVYNNMQALRSDQATFVNALAVGGYETVLAGRMHFVGTDQRHGFEKRLVGDITPTHIGAANDTYGKLAGTTGQTLKALENSGAGNSAVLDYDLAVTAAACEYMQGDRERPLFMTIGLYGPHCPYVAPPELYRYYYDTLPVPEDVTMDTRGTQHPFIQKWCRLRGITSVAAETIRRVRAGYYALVERMDELVGRILEAVENNLGSENTIILYGSDHGDCIGAHGMFWKSNFYEGSSRVPLLFSWPGHIPSGVRLHGVSSLLDLAPTLLRLTGSPELPGYDGMDIHRNLLAGKELPSDRIVVSECSDLKGDAPGAMIRSGHYKLNVYATYDTPQLFDVDNDPNEEHDLSCVPEYRGIRKKLEYELGRHWTPERALADLDTARRHFQLMKQWVTLVQPKPIEKWRCDESRNYRDGE